MIKKEMKEIEVYYCDNCGAKIAESPYANEIDIYKDINGNVIYLCESCWSKLPICIKCRRFAFSEEDLFYDVNILNCEALCQHCLKKELAYFEQSISAANTNQEQKEMKSYIYL